MRGPFFYMRQAYRQAMEWLYLACVLLSGAAMIVITLIIPLGVFMRYAMNHPLSWPEPASVVMMVMFAFVGGAAVYRANGQIAVEAVLNAVSAQAKKRMLRGVNVCIGIAGLFLFLYGIRLCIITWNNTMAEFPQLHVGLVYLPVPVGGLLTLLFLLEKVWLGDPPKSSVMYSDQAAELQ
jgi:TRAP-type C4-dicarboxylate transport system permease small subunit